MCCSENPAFIYQWGPTHIQVIWLLQQCCLGIYKINQSKVIKVWISWPNLYKCTSLTSGIQENLYHTTHVPWPLRRFSNSILSRIISLSATPSFVRSWSCAWREQSHWFGSLWHKAADTGLRQSAVTVWVPSTAGRKVNTVFFGVILFNWLICYATIK